MGKIEYEYHDMWPRDWTYWLSMPDQERRYAFYDPEFWETITKEQQTNFHVEADWQELRHVKGARQEKLDSLMSMEDTCTHLGLDHVRVYWLMSTRKLPGWLVGGFWKFDKLQIDRWVEDFGGIGSVKRDIEDQIAKHRAAQDAPAKGHAKPKPAAATETASA